MDATVPFVPGATHMICSKPHQANFFVAGGQKLQRLLFDRPCVFVACLPNGDFRFGFGRSCPLGKMPVSIENFKFLSIEYLWSFCLGHEHNSTLSYAPIRTATTAGHKMNIFYRGVSRGIITCSENAVHKLHQNSYICFDGENTL